jgi:PPOX class probable F420-dependent enzyme
VEDDTMRRRVTEARVGRLGTVTPDGVPHLVPCCYVLEGDTVYSAVDAKPKSTLALRRLDNVRSHPAAALLIDHYADDWSTLWWIRLDATARILASDDPERASALTLLQSKYSQYRATAPPGPVLALDVHTWRSWSAT